MRSPLFFCPVRFMIPSNRSFSSRVYPAAPPLSARQEAPLYQQPGRAAEWMMVMQRSSGILMPVFSLPSPYGIGTLGQAAGTLSTL